jgi:hypothetical protein
MSTLSQAVQEAIQKDLPGIAANELAQFIKNAERTAELLETTKKHVAVLTEQNNRLTDDLNKHRSLDEREAELAKREAATQTRELELLRQEAGLAAKIAQAELAGVKDTMGAFLRNTTFRQTVVADVAKPVDGHPGGNGYNGSPGYLTRNPDSRPDTTTTTETTE